MTTGDDVMRDLSRAIANAVNYHGLDSRLNMADYAIADLITPQVYAAISRASNVTIDDDAVERARDELLAHCVCTESSDGENRNLMLKAARAALEAAFPASTSEWNAAIEAAAKECDASAAHLDERSAAWDAVKYLAQAIRALSKKD